MKSYHIVGYTYDADIYCPSCIVGMMRDLLRSRGWKETEIGEVEDWYREQNSNVDVGWSAGTSEATIRTVAEEFNIDYDDPYSYDSDHLPKVIFADMVEGEEHCGSCHERIME